MEYFKFKNGMEVPALGFGTWQLEGDSASKPLDIALKTGYRHIDTADVYGNQKQIGEVLSNLSIPRQELFITSKVWYTNLDASGIKQYCERALRELKLDYIDLLLIHWPNSEIPLGETLKALYEIREDGFINNFGVSNFTIEHMKSAFSEDHGEHIVTNQVEYHPTLNQEELREYCEGNDVLITAYSPIAQGQDLELPEIKDIADTYSRSPAQVILAWIRQKHIIAIPRSSSEDHIKDNFASTSLQLKDVEMKTIDSLNRNNRLVEPSFAEFD